MARAGWAPAAVAWVRHHRTAAMLTSVLAFLLLVLFLTLATVYSKESRALLMSSAPHGSPGLLTATEDDRHPVHDAPTRRPAAPAARAARAGERDALLDSLGDVDGSSAKPKPRPRPR